jgi:Zn-dependent metalloprotease
MTHGVTQFTANLDYRDQSGALNESISDVFGSLVKQWTLNQTADEADWLIGEGLLMPNVHGTALRSMKAPGTAFDDPVLGGKDPQPDQMSAYIKTSEDQGGVHLNSGIPNRAFYLAATAIGGNAWEKAGLIWYRTLATRLASNAQFLDAANATVSVAGEAFGDGSDEQSAVRDAWQQVGVLPAS